MKCAECGHENTNNPKYCTRCGSPLASGGGDAGQKRVTVGEAGLFDRPVTQPPSFAPPASHPSGQVRRTSLEEGGAAPNPMLRQSQPIAMPGRDGMRSRTVLDEGPAPAAAGPGAPAAGAQAGPGTARIVGWMVSYDHDTAGQQFLIRAGRNRIGRSRDNEISVFTETKASDLHATIIWRNGQAAVKDEGSTNGTFVDGEDVGIAQVSPLQSGQTLRIGNSIFLVFLVDAQAAAGIWPDAKWAR